MVCETETWMHRCSPRFNFRLRRFVQRTKRPSARLHSRRFRPNTDYELPGCGLGTRHLWRGKATGEPAVSNRRLSANPQTGQGYPLRTCGPAPATHSSTTCLLFVLQWAFDENDVDGYTVTRAEAPAMARGPCLGVLPDNVSKSRRSLAALRPPPTQSHSVPLPLDGIVSTAGSSGDGSLPRQTTFRRPRVLRWLHRRNNDRQTRPRVTRHCPSPTY